MFELLHKTIDFYLKLWSYFLIYTATKQGFVIKKKNLDVMKKKKDKVSSQLSSSETKFHRAIPK